MLFAAIIIVATVAVAHTVTAQTTEDDGTSSISESYHCPAISQDLFRSDCDRGVGFFGCRRTVENQQVSELQRFLISYYPDNRTLVASGGFFNVTRAAVRLFQLEHGLITQAEYNANIGGAVRAATRAKIAAFCGGTVQTQPPQNQPGALYSWQTRHWSICYNGTQRRAVYCASNTGAPVDESLCTPPKPPITQSCTSATQSCRLPWGATLDHDRSVTAFETASVPGGQLCVREQRTCTNGTLDGSFLHQDCRPLPVTYSWQLGAWNACSNNQQTRTVTCLSSTGQTALNSLCPTPEPSTTQSCTTANQSCTLSGITKQHNETATFYRSTTAPFGQECLSQVRTCSNGSFTGDTSYQYASCTVAQPLSCTLPTGGTLAHGQEITTTGGGTCGWSETYRCTNGVLAVSRTTTSCAVTYSWYMEEWGQCVNGTQTRVVQCKSNAGTVVANSYCTGAPPAISQACTTNLSCTLSGVTRAHGTSAAFYNSETVPYGQSCLSQQRTCSNGSFTGDTSYVYARCVAASPLHCTFNGAVVEHGAPVTAYDVTAVLAGQSCQSHAQTRTCQNGFLTGEYPYSYCYVQNDPITYSWQIGAWGQCTNGTQTRSVYCRSSQGQNATDQMCINNGAGQKPAMSQGCSTGGTVLPPAPACSITATYDYGGAGYAQLRWTTSNALSASIDQGVGSVHLQSTFYNTPGIYFVELGDQFFPRTYTMTVAGAGGSGQCSATTAALYGGGGSGDGGGGGGDGGGYTQASYGGGGGGYTQAGYDGGGGTGGDGGGGF
jgi:hypothetical protein